MILIYGQDILLGNARSGVKLEVLLEKSNPDAPDLEIKNFKAIFEFEFKYQTDVKKLRTEFEAIGEKLSTLVWKMIKKEKIGKVKSMMNAHWANVKLNRRHEDLKNKFNTSKRKSYKKLNSNIF